MHVLVFINYNSRGFLMNIRCRCGEMCVTLYSEGLGIESRLQNILRFSLFKRELLRAALALGVMCEDETSRTLSGAIQLLPHTYSCHAQEEPLHLPF